MMLGKLSMKIGQSKFVDSSKHAINCALFEGLFTIKNGTITEEINPKDPVFERYTVGVKESNWTILVWDEFYVPISVNAESIPKYVLDRIVLKLTTTDKKYLEEIRDCSLVGGFFNECYSSDVTVPVAAM